MKIKENPSILIINWQDWINPQGGGAEVHLHEIFKRLTYDYDITLLCSGFDEASPYEEIDGIKIHRVGSRNTFNFFVPSAYKSLCRAGDFVLVIEDLNKIPFLGRFYIKEKRMAILHHLFGESIYLETNILFGSYVYYTERLIPKFYRDIPITVVSESTKEDLIRMGLSAKNIEVIYNGVDINRYQFSSKLYDRPTIVCLGRMKRYKRMDILIEGLSGVVERIPSLQVLFLGSGDYLPVLKKLAIDRGLEKIIEFKGFVPGDEKREILSKSWISVNTSPKEGWGLTSMEAQASGTPSIVPDSPGLKETVRHGETGFIYPYGSINALSSILIELLSDKERVIEMGGKAREWASNFSWDYSAERMDAFIKGVISNHF